MTKIEQLEQMLVSNPNDAFLKYALAMSYASAGQTAEAARRLGVFNQEHPDDVSGYFQRGKLLAKLGETDTAREVLSTGIQVARSKGDDHAVAEMTAFLDMVD